MDGGMWDMQELEEKHAGLDLESGSTASSAVCEKRMKMMWIDSYVASAVVASMFVAATIRVRPDKVPVSLASWTSRSCRQ